MTGWRVERTPRTAFPVPSDATGDRSLMPPPSQGAERRTERRARRTGVRWGLRALVIGGLAGAAWLLTGTAAQAADHEPAATGPSLLGSVVAGDIAQPAVSSVLTVDAQPPEADRPAHRHHNPVSLLPEPARALTALTGAASERSTGVASSSVVRVAGEVTGSLRLAGGPADSPLASVTDPLVGTLHPVTGLLPQVVKLPQVAELPHVVKLPRVVKLPGVAESPHAAKPAGTAPRPTARPAAHGARGHRPIAAPAATPRAVSTSSVVQTGPAPSTVATAELPRARHNVAPARTVVHRHSVARVVAGPETIRETPDDGDRPAPLQAHLGAFSGLLTSGSGSPTEGGSAAFLPAAVAASSMALHRLALPADVEARRYDAGAPTVPPD
jgi:hypothetical protein